MKTSLVLEGGGMRGVFTAGILDFFIENDLHFDNCFGVSAGACQACNFLAEQKNRGYRTLVDYIDDKRYCGLYSLLTTGDIFGVDFSYNEVPNKLYPIDNESFKKNKTKFYAVLTKLKNGQAYYKEITDLLEDMVYIRASSSLPFVSRKVMIDNEYYLDGGIADSIPIRQSVNMGNDKNIIILTREKEYRKKPNKHNILMKTLYSKYPLFIRSMKNRHAVYNETLEYIEENEKNGRFFVLRPECDLGIDRIEKNKTKLKEAYDKGYMLASRRYSELLEYLKK